MINRLPSILDRTCYLNIVTGTLPKLHAVKKVPLAQKNEIKTELVQMVKKDHIE